MSTDVRLSDDGITTDIKLTFVGRGGKKSMPIQHKVLEDLYGRRSGISQTTSKAIQISKMRKEENHVQMRANSFRAFEEFSVREQ